MTFTFGLINWSDGRYAIPLQSLDVPPCWIGPSRQADATVSAIHLTQFQLLPHRPTRERPGDHTTGRPTTRMRTSIVGPEDAVAAISFDAIRVLVSSFCVSLRQIQLRIVDVAIARSQNFHVGKTSSPLKLTAAVCPVCVRPQTLTFRFSYLQN